MSETLRWILMNEPVDLSPLCLVGNDYAAFNIHGLICAAFRAPLDSWWWSDGFVLLFFCRHLMLRWDHETKRFEGKNHAALRKLIFNFFSFVKKDFFPYFCWWRCDLWLADYCADHCSGPFSSGGSASCLIASDFVLLSTRRRLCPPPPPLVFFLFMIDCLLYISLRVSFSWRGKNGGHGLAIFFLHSYVCSRRALLLRI